ncbi:hypothetical protein BCR36DRAFT_581807 [Piromyces finnis]|uniref:NAD(P)-binding domain-containing protein n=1 Tax=Piromyces finnis TaxID=1754191 RepID=A0A1Y1VG51_9FUNG|nr:hypothetical protein BCR36DRAFT_581807 [Piromyces finnis]|eukprot:ORX54171.1 hypothetical protein BCR36DRAFT_581807 [Piromyces finnis]
MSSVLVIGSTGATGVHVINELLKCGLFEKVTSVARRKLEYTGINKSKLVQHIIDFEKIEEYKDVFKGHSHMISCFGTTRKIAGTAEMQHRIDHDYVYNAAKFFKEQNSNVKLHYIHMSSGQADVNSSFQFIKTKGQLEDDLKSLKFSRLTIFRPAPLLDRGHDKRFFESIFGFIAKGINCVVNSKVGIPVTTLAKAMVRVTQIQPKTDLDVVNDTFIEYYFTKDAYALADRTDIPGFEITKKIENQ